MSGIFVYLHNNYESHFGSDHMPVVDIVLVLLGVPGRIPKISIPEVEKCLMVSSRTSRFNKVVICPQVSITPFSVVIVTHREYLITCVVSIIYLKLG